MKLLEYLERGRGRHKRQKAPTSAPPGGQSLLRYRREADDVVGGLSVSDFHEYLVLLDAGSKALKEQASLKLEFANGSRIIGIPEGADQIRSYHPWGLLMDEAACQPEAGEAYDAAVPVCQRIIVVSSAGPGWFADFLTEAL